MKQFLQRNRIGILFLLLGILHRLVFLLFINHMFDFRNILALVKSVVDTGDLSAGFYTVKKAGLEIQLYGKIYYQLAAIWLILLEKLKILNISSLSNPFQWNPLFYQIILIKLFQFFYDFILLFFMYKLGEILEIKNKSLVIFFWAINSFMVFPAYAMFQSDLAMMAFMTGGIYFAVKSLKDSNNNVKFKLASLFLFALGAVIKQTPILIVPFTIILFSNSIVSFILYSSSFTLFYLILSQPWSADALLMRQFFLNSKESMALFNFQLNSVPVFLFLYFSLLFLLFFKGKGFFQKPFSFFLLTIIILVTVYISESADLFFPQFTIWIMPLLTLLILLKPEYTIFMLAPVIGFFKRSMIDNDFLAGSLSSSFSSSLSDLPKYEVLSKTFINPILLDYLLNTFVVLLYFYLFILLLRELKIFFFQINSPFLNFIQQNYKKILIVIFLSYYVLLSLDFIIKSNLIVLNNNKNQEISEKISPAKNPISINIYNPERITVNALEFKVLRKNNNVLDNIIFKFTDLKTNKIIYEQKYSDYFFPTTEGVITVFLNKGINNEEFALNISEEFNKDDVFFNKVRLIKNSNAKKDLLTINYKDNPFQITLRGNLPYNLLLANYLENITKQPKFFAIYYFFVSGCTCSIFILSRLT